MPVEILMPELGESVHEGTVTKWMKKVGDFVKEDEPVVEIMTDKVNQELQAPASGILVKIIVAEGDEVKVFEAMGLIEEDVEAAKKMIAEGGGAPAASAPTTEIPAEVKAEARAEVPTQPAEEVPAADGGRHFYTPVVRVMAKEHGISERELASLTGSGAGGRVTKRDLEAYVANRGSGAPISVPTPAAVPQFKDAPATVAKEGQEIVPLVGMRKMIAEAMMRSSQVPTVSTLIEVDVTKMVDFRAHNKDSFVTMYGVKFTYTPFFIKAIAEVLSEFPYVNAALMPDNKIVVNHEVHMGVAVSLGKDGSGGLIVPVIRDCHKKSVIQIAKDLDGIAQAARGNTLGVADVQGATFTLTNPGSYGAVLGTPMINSPQSGILGTYGIIKRPVIVNDMIAIRSMMNIVLTYDHRLVDGMMAGKFLQSLKMKLEGFDFFK